jgi:hypothetical protein
VDHRNAKTGRRQFPTAARRLRLHHRIPHSQVLRRCAGKPASWVGPAR